MLPQWSRNWDASRDVLTILENYKRHAGPDFARELDVLTADMRSSSYEAALVRFEGRLASPMLSDIVRGNHRRPARG